MTSFSISWRLLLPALLAAAAPAAAGDAASSVTPTPHTLSDSQRLRRTPVVEVFQRTAGAVVNISSTQIIIRRTRTPLDLFFQDFEELFGPGFAVPREQQFRSTSVGSGFVIHPSGYIVTNAHVVDQTVERKVIFSDQRSFDAEIVAIEREHDLALLRINSPDRLPVIQLGRSDDLMIGETAIAIGNPLGYQHTLTTGVISAVHRDLELYNRQANAAVTYADLIQTDASINPGNSGGPLLNILGELIGINTAIRGDAQNIGFAIPVNTLREVLPGMLRTERDNRFNIGMDVNGQLEVVAVWSDSPAMRAGLEIGDRITAINGVALDNELDFYFELLDHGPGDLLQVRYQRSGQQEQVGRILLQDRVRPDGAKLALAKLGIGLEVLDGHGLRNRLPASAGLLIREVQRGGPADQVGIRPGDVLTALGRYHVDDLDEVGQLLQQTRTGERIYIEIIRIERGRAYRDGAEIVIR